MSFWKTHKCKLISNWTRKTVWFLINNINMKKNSREGSAGRSFLKPFFLIRENFWKFPHKIFIIISCDFIGLENFLLSFSQSWLRIMMCNLHWCYTFCTGVTRFALMLLLNCTALSQSESSNFFHVCYYNEIVGKQGQKYSTKM